MVLDSGEERTGAIVIPRGELRELHRGRQRERENDKSDSPYVIVRTAHADMGLVLGRIGQRN